MKSRLGLPGGDDPAYAHEMGQLADACRDFVRVFDEGDFDRCLFYSGTVIAHCAALYKLSPPGGLLDVPAMFQREEES